MPKIEEYTQGIVRQRAVPNTVNLQAIQDAGATAQAIGQVADIGSEYLKGVVEQQNKERTRYETIQRARAVSQFQQEIEADMTKFQTENDLTDPRVVKEFNNQIRGKLAKFTQQHDGGKESKESLEIQLLGVSDTATAQMSQAATAAQKKFITSQVGSHIDRIAKEVYANPASIETAFKQLNGLTFEYGPALDSVDEMELISNAQSMIVEGALNSFIDAGDYEGAQQLALENDRFIAKMPAKQQMSVLGRINSGLAAQEKERNELSNKMRSMKAAAQEMGVEVTPNQIFGAATGIKATDKPEDKINAFAQAIGVPRDQMTPAMVAKIGFGVDLPSANIDMNSERLPDGGYTPKGIGAVIKAPYEAAANTKIMVDKVLLQADEFINTDNSQAGLAAMISFQKLIDDGAAVREGDIKLSAQGNSAYDNIKLMMKQLDKGAIATPKQIEQMKKSAEIFGQSVLEASKTYIDPYLQESKERGYRMIDIGLPQASYDAIFKNVKTSEDTNKRNKEIEEKAKARGLTVAEALTQTAKKRNMTVEEVAKQLGYTGKLQ